VHRRDAALLGRIRLAPRYSVDPSQADLNYDIVSHYEEQGWEVVEVKDDPVAVGTPFVLNNCVGHVKSVLGITSWALTPYQLYKWATRQPRLSMLTVPGFGGGSSAPAYTPPPEPVKVKRSPEEDYPAHEDPDKRRRLRAGKKTTSTLMETEESTSDKGTLLK